jgi:hypothetical protein
LSIIFLPIIITINHNQRNRRNLTDAEIYQCIKVVDKRKNRGGDHKSEEFKNQKSESKFLISEDKSNSGKEDKSKDTATKTADIVGVGRTKVTEARTVIDNAEKHPDIEERVLKGEVKISAAAEEIKKREVKAKETKSPPRSVFNETNESIEWARWTWNPITGCKHGCKYCYARDTRSYTPIYGS